MFVDSCSNLMFFFKVYGASIVAFFGVFHFVFQGPCKDIPLCPRIVITLKVNLPLKGFMYGRMDTRGAGYPLRTFLLE